MRAVLRAIFLSFFLFNSSFLPVVRADSKGFVVYSHPQIKEKHVDSSGLVTLRKITKGKIEQIVSIHKEETFWGAIVTVETKSGYLIEFMYWTNDGGRVAYNRLKDGLSVDISSCVVYVKAPDSIQKSRPKNDPENEEY